MSVDTLGTSPCPITQRPARGRWASRFVRNLATIAAQPRPDNWLTAHCIKDPSAAAAELADCRLRKSPQCRRNRTAQFCTVQLCLVNIIYSRVKAADATLPRHTALDVEKYSRTWRLYSTCQSLFKKSLNNMNLLPSLLSPKALIEGNGSISPQLS